jgi:hypothetical protein
MLYGPEQVEDMLSESGSSISGELVEPGIPLKSLDLLTSGR